MPAHVHGSCSAAGLRTGVCSAFILLALAASARAEDLAVWKDGAGTIAGVVAVAHAPIAAGSTFATGPNQIATVDVTTAPGSVMKLGHGAAGTLSVETDAKGKHLILVVDRGAIEFSLKDRGPYIDMHTRGAAMDVRITGTLFIFERVHRDQDYIALVNGHVTVSLRREIADTLGKTTNDEVSLLARQGLPATISGGIGQIEQLSSRPTVTDARSIHDQGTSGAGTDGSWGAGSPTAGGPIDPELIIDIKSGMIEHNAADSFEDLDRGILSIQILGTALGSSGNGPLGKPPRPPH